MLIPDSFAHNQAYYQALEDNYNKGFAHAVAQNPPAEYALSDWTAQGILNTLGLLQFQSADFTRIKNQLRFLFQKAD